MVKKNMYEYMSSPQIALQTIAELIAYKSSLREQDRWLQACIKLGYVAREGEEE